MMPFPSQIIKSDHGAEITITSQKVLIREPDRLGPGGKTIPGDIIELSINDIHNITRTISNKFGVDISKDDFRKQFEC